MNRVADVIRDDIKVMTAYQVADLPEGFIKLDAMECPHHPFAGYESLLSEWADIVKEAPIHLYPHTAKSGIYEELREVFGIPGKAEIALGNGSDELIQFLTMLVAKLNACVLGIEPSFVMYRHNAALYGMEYVGVPLNPDFTLNLPAVLSAIEQHQPSLIFIAYPNNPTGVCFKREEVEAVVSEATGIVVVDEAYGAFHHDSFLPWAGEVANLVVMRTISKIGFAGLRMGYAAASPGIIGELAKILPPYNMNQLSLAAAKFSLKHHPIIQQNIDTLKNERSRVMNELLKLNRLQVFPSEANFITVRVPDADGLFETLKQNRILIKKLHGSHPLLDQCVRITIGSAAQNDAVLAVIKNLYPNL